MAGFSIYIENGKVIKWLPVMEEPQLNFQPGGNQKAHREQSFQLFLATGSLSNVVNIVDSEGSAGASDFPSPDMTVKAKVFIDSNGSERSVILLLNEQDAANLKILSEGNLGKRLLIVFGNRVIAAPVISALVDSRQLAFTVKNSVVLDE